MLSAMTSWSLRKRNRRTATPSPSAFILAVGAGLLLTILLMLVYCLDNRHNNEAFEYNNNDASNNGFLRLSSTKQGNTPDDAEYPNSFVDIWPDDSKNDGFYETLWNCIPQAGKETPCHVRYFGSNNNSNQDKLQRVAIARPPGRLGKAFEVYLQHLINHHPNEAMQIELIPIHHSMDLQHNYSKIIRFTTVPVLLEAADLALVSASNSRNIKMEEVENIARQLVRWHCHLSQNAAAGTPLLTITLDRLMGYPQASIKRLQSFLGLIPYDDPKQNKIDFLDDMALIVMDTIDEASSLLMSLDSSHGKALRENIQPQLDQVIQSEVKASKNNKECQDIQDGSMATTEPSKLMSHFLSPDRDISDASICRQYQGSVLCATTS